MNNLVLYFDEFPFDKEKILESNLQRGISDEDKHNYNFYKYDESVEKEKLKQVGHSNYFKKFIKSEVEGEFEIVPIINFYEFHLSNCYCFYNTESTEQKKIEGIMYDDSLTQKGGEGGRNKFGEIYKGDVGQCSIISTISVNIDNMKERGKYRGKHHDKTLRSCDFITSSSGENKQIVFEGKYNKMLNDIYKLYITAPTNVDKLKMKEEQKEKDWEEIIDTYKHLYNKLLRRNYLFEIIEIVQKLHKDIVKENIKNSYIKKVKTSDKVIIIGDLHGSFHTFFRIMIRLHLTGVVDLGKMDINEPYTIIMLGDIVDRGQYSLIILYILFVLHTRNPQKIFFIRGNHETESMNYNGGFYEELKILDENGKNLHKKMNDLFNYFPCAILLQYMLEGKQLNYWLAHGGFPVDINEDGFPKVYDLKNFINDEKQLIYSFEDINKNNWDTYVANITKKVKTIAESYPKSEFFSTSMRNILNKYIENASHLQTAYGIYQKIIADITEILPADLKKFIRILTQDDFDKLYIENNMLRTGQIINEIKSKNNAIKFILDNVYDKKEKTLKSSSEFSDFLYKLVKSYKGFYPLSIYNLYDHFSATWNTSHPEKIIMTPREIIKMYNRQLLGFILDNMYDVPKIQSEKKNQLLITNLITQLVNFYPMVQNSHPFADPQYQCMWSDMVNANPILITEEKKQLPFILNIERGVYGLTLSNKMVEEFLETNNIEMIIRGHEDRFMNAFMHEKNDEYVTKRINIKEVESKRNFKKESKNIYQNSTKQYLSGTPPGVHAPTSKLIALRKGDDNYMNVVTISTATDAGRELCRDSFIMLTPGIHVNKEVYTSELSLDN